MSIPTEIRKYQFVSPPRAYGPTGPVGQEIVVGTSPTPHYLDLSKLTYGLSYSTVSPDAAQGAGSPPNIAEGAIGNYITIYADGADVGIIVGATAASVSGGAAPVLSAVGTISGSGTYQGATGTCHRIPAGQERRYHTQLNRDSFLGYVGGASGTMRIYQSNPPGM